MSTTRTNGKSALIGAFLDIQLKVIRSVFKNNIALNRPSIFSVDTNLPLNIEDNEILLNSNYSSPHFTSYFYSVQANESFSIILNSLATMIRNNNITNNSGYRGSGFYLIIENERK